MELRVFPDLGKMLSRPSMGDFSAMSFNPNKKYFRESWRDYPVQFAILEVGGVSGE